MDAIEVCQRPLSETRTPTLACEWEAVCSAGKKAYKAVSRHGSTHELARTLINDLGYDAKMAVRTEGRAGHMTIPSIREWARWTYSGDQRVLYERVQAAKERLTALREEHAA